jgi:hypothetical protein
MKLVEGVDWYRDPVAGLEVWTRKFLLDRGFCCNGGCRHCPYDEEGRPVMLPEESIRVLGVDK